MHFRGPLRRGSCDHSDPGTCKAVQAVRIPHHLLQKRGHRGSAVQGKEYDLADKSQLAAFLQDADVQLVPRARGRAKQSPNGGSAQEQVGVVIPQVGMENHPALWPRTEVA